MTGCVILSDEDGSYEVLIIVEITLPQLSWDTLSPTSGHIDVQHL